MKQQRGFTPLEILTGKGKHRGNQKFLTGFTLIELLVVIAIIGVLASVVLVSLNSARAKSRDAKRVGDVRQMQTALELYFNDCNSYPAGLNLVLSGQILVSGTVSGGTCSGGGWAGAGGSTYLQAAPTAPLPVDNASGAACNATNNSYTYSQQSSGSDYLLTFCLGQVTGGLSAGVRTAQSGGIR